MLNDFLLTHSLRFCLIAFFILESLNLVILSESLDQLGFQFPALWFLRSVMTWRTHSANSAAWCPIKTRQAIRIHGIGAASLALPREHHQPFIVFLCILFLFLSRLVPGEICMHHSSEICAAVGLNNHEVSKVDV